MWYVGLDWHLRSSTAWILDENGKKVKHFTQKGHWSLMVERLAEIKKKHRRQLAICIEASCGYGVLCDRLCKFARRVEVAHPGELRLIYKDKRKCDRVDAQKLATLLFLDQVPKAYVPDIDVRAHRELIESRRTEVDEQTRIKNRIRTLLRSYGIAMPRGGKWLWTEDGRQWFARQQWVTASGKYLAGRLLVKLEQVEEAIRELTSQLDAILKKDPRAVLLMSIPGVGPRTAETILAYIDKPQRFSRIGQISAYFGLVPQQDSSGDRVRFGHITKQGPATARRLLIEASWQMIRRCPAAKAVFERVSQGKKERRKVALVAVAHKLLRTMGGMLKSGEMWNEQAWSQQAGAAA